MNIIEKYLSEHFRFHIPGSFSVPEWHKNYWDFNADQLSAVSSECDWSWGHYAGQPLSSSLCGEPFLRRDMAVNPHAGTPYWSEGVIPFFSFNSY